MDMALGVGGGWTNDFGGGWEEEDGNGSRSSGGRVRFSVCLGIWKIRDQMNIWIVIQAGIHHDESKEM